MDSGSANSFSPGAFRLTADATPVSPYVAGMVGQTSAGASTGSGIVPPVNSVPLHHVPQDQKRQRSTSSFPLSKRPFQSEQRPLSMGYVQQHAQLHAQLHPLATAGTLGTSHFASTSRNPHLILALGNTPTPSYDVPSSPSSKMMPHNNNSDLSESNDKHDEGEETMGHETNPESHRMSEEEQQLAAKLKETYKNIVNYEEAVQRGCIEITIKMNQAGYSRPMTTVPARSDLLNDLWTVYYQNIALLDNYYDFLITAVRPVGRSRTGRNIVDLYKIPRRMWVYGVVGFLEVLKNVINLFSEHEICLCFIANCFCILSNLTDPGLDMEGWWLEKLGDLSRMAIALYALRFIDWKALAEHWYAMGLRTLYGHGKIYYHMCTVQQDNLDALVNIGKLVCCRDPFVPTPQYLRLVVENICTQRNVLSLLELPTIDFIKIHKVLLSIHPADDPNHDSQVLYGVNLVTRYGLTFGSDSNGFNFFTKEFYSTSGTGVAADPYYQHASTTEKTNFWFNKGALFAVSNINHLIGFGDPRNPFAKLFGLPEALKERKDKKDKKRKSRGSIPTDDLDIDEHFIHAEELTVNEWFGGFSHLNKSVLELLVRVLSHYLVGPKEASTPHVIVWLYFLVAVGKALQRYPNASEPILWLFRRIFPWELLINYLNYWVKYVKANRRLSEACSRYVEGDYLTTFNNNEILVEVWRCWGTLWFDIIAEKGDYSDSAAAGVLNSNIFDLPVSGVSAAISNEPTTTVHSDNDERIVRVILLGRFLAEHMPYGLVRTNDGFRFDATIYQRSEANSALDSFVANDGRFVNLVSPLRVDNLVDSRTIAASIEEKDSQWFQPEADPSPMIFDEEAYVDSELDDDPEFNNDLHYMYHHEQHHHALERESHATGDNLYDDAYTMDYPLGNNTTALEGNLGDRMDTNVTYIAIDTNIWLKHCGRIFKCVRNNAFKILIPLIVFQELRLLRKSAEAIIADAATRSVIIIRELYLTKEILPLRYDGNIASDINETTEFENNSNWRNSVDETILSAVNDHDEIGKNMLRGLNMTITLPTTKQQKVLDTKWAKMFRYCILISDDRNVRLRARTIGLTSFQSKWLFNQLEAIFPAKCID